eukprot:CAMPEP_0196717818 /NCGR_PEP_ID=MMETSP1091-20130531/1158_1 /TAXON_ID=302021 /ORGANISM="Rhodomonas sp., Strain CCMP768" /LENGTH=143 /DNA_ID=CAMNT_0042058309 /DNA_START=11 /DNA_END=442 /DNA_ORIENTATION=+
MTSTISKAIAVQKKYLRMLVPQTQPNNVPETVEQYDAKPAWRLLGARKLAREAINGDHEAPEHVETQQAVLSNRLAWKVLAHRRRERMALAQCDKDATDLGCCRSKKPIQDNLKVYLAEVEEVCANVEETLEFDQGGLNEIMN